MTFTQGLREGLLAATELAVLMIDAMALAIVLAGSLQAFLAASRSLLVERASGVQRREIWLRYARVLVAALTFQLAADILETAAAETWEAVARLGLVAVIRTFLNVYLERDLSETRERQRSGSAPE